MKQNLTIIGYGYWGKKIAKLLVELGDSVSVVESNSITATPSNLQRISFTALQHQLESTFCFLATPEETHYQLAKKLLLSGKHVFIEKPLSLKKIEAQQLCDLATKNNLSIYVDYIFLFDPYVQKILELVESNTLGKLKSIHSKRNSVGFYKPKITVFDDLAMHDLYLGRFFTNAQPRLIETKRLKSDGTTTVEGSVAFLFDEVLYSAHYSWVQPNSRRILTIIGTKGKITWDKDKEFLLLEKAGHSERINIDANVSALEVSICTFLSLCEEEAKSKRIHRYAEYIEDVSMLESMRELAYSTLQPQTTT